MLTKTMPTNVIVQSILFFLLLGDVTINARRIRGRKARRLQSQENCTAKQHPFQDSIKLLFRNDDGDDKDSIIPILQEALPIIYHQQSSSCTSDNAAIINNVRVTLLQSSDYLIAECLLDGVRNVNSDCTDNGSTRRSLQQQQRRPDGSKREGKSKSKSERNKPYKRTVAPSFSPSIVMSSSVPSGIPALSNPSIDTSATPSANLKLATGTPSYNPTTSPGCANTSMPPTLFLSLVEFTHTTSSSADDDIDDSAIAEQFRQAYSAIATQTSGCLSRSIAAARVVWSTSLLNNDVEKTMTTTTVLLDIQWNCYAADSDISECQLFSSATNAKEILLEEMNTMMRMSVDGKNDTAPPLTATSDDDQLMPLSILSQVSELETTRVECSSPFSLEPSSFQRLLTFHLSNSNATAASLADAIIPDKECPSLSRDEFSSVIVVSLTDTSGQFEEGEILNDMFRQTFNELRYNGCDEWKRRVHISTLKILQTREVVVEEGPDMVTVNVQITVTSATCRGCTAAAKLFDDGDDEGGRQLVDTSFDGTVRASKSLQEEIIADGISNFAGGGGYFDCFCPNPALPLFHDGQYLISTPTHQQQSTTVDSFVKPLQVALGHQTDITIQSIREVQDFLQTGEDDTGAVFLERVDCDDDIQPFSSTLFVEFLSESGGVSMQDIDTLQAGFVSVYNDASVVLCDPSFRFLETAEFQQIGGIRTTQRKRRRRGLEEGNTQGQFNATDFDNNGTASASINATTTTNIHSSNSTSSNINTTFGGDGNSVFNRTKKGTGIVKFRVFVQGTCRGCKSGTNLFDDGFRRRASELNARRSGQSTLFHATRVRLHDTRRRFLQSVNRTSEEGCYCELGSIDAFDDNTGSGTPITEELFEEAFTNFTEELVVTGQIETIASLNNLIEVSQVSNCTDDDINLLDARVFLSMVVAKSNQSNIDEDEIRTLESAFVSTYNGLTELYCDRLFRRVTKSAFTVLGIRQSGDNTTYDSSMVADFRIDVNGTCRGCDTSNTTLFVEHDGFLLDVSPTNRSFSSSAHYDDSASTMFSGSVPHEKRFEVDIFAGYADIIEDEGETRDLQEATNDDCYCSDNPSEGRPPSEAEFVAVLQQNVLKLTDQGALPGSVRDIESMREANVIKTADGTILEEQFCSNEVQQLESTVFVDVVAHDGVVSQSDIKILEEGFVSVYNGLPICDPFFRTVQRAEFNVVNGGFRRRRRRIQNVMTMADNITNIPRNGSNATTAVINGTGSQYPELYNRTRTGTQVLRFRVVVFSFCRGCPKDTNLFDDGFRRRLNLDVKLDDQAWKKKKNRFVGGELAGECYCELNSDFEGPTEELFEQLYSNYTVEQVSVGRLTTVQNVAELVEVGEAPACNSKEQNMFQSAVFMSLNVDSTNIEEDDTFTLESAFLSTYNSLSELACDSLFRRLSTVVFTFLGVRRVDDVVGEYLEVALTDELNPEKQGLSGTTQLVADYRVSGTGTCRECQVGAPLFNGVGREARALHDEHRMASPSRHRSSSSRMPSNYVYVSKRFNSWFDSVQRSQGDPFLRGLADVASSPLDCFCADESPNSEVSLIPRDFIRLFDTFIGELAQQQALDNVQGANAFLGQSEEDFWV